MLTMKPILVLIIIIVYIDYYSCVEPITTSAIVGGLVLSASYSGFQYMKCKHWECCDDLWITPNIEKLERSLTSRLHGQHLVNFTVVRAIRGHLKNPNPKKALVMAFHGWTGGGKNYASKIIVENIFKNGAKSNFVHWYISTHHFPHRSHIENYKDIIRRDIREHTMACGRSVFVFDEIDKMPPGVVDALKSFLDYHEEIDGIDYRRNIFIFLSNTGGAEIAKVGYQFWLNGMEREDITLKDIESLVTKGAFNEDGGLHHSEIIGKNLIDLYVPFFPLERNHVVMCIRDELQSRSKFTTLDDIDQIKNIADQLDYWPPEFKLYSTSGCKKISQKIDLYAGD